MDEQEKAWILAFLSGDRSAFDLLVLRYKDRIFNLCYRYMGGDYEEASDCAQEAFIRAFRSLAGYRFESSFSTWMYALTVNVCRNRLDSSHYRHSKAMMQVGSEGCGGGSNPGSDLDPEDPAPSPLARMEMREREREIQRAIGTLPAEMRSVVILRDVEGLSYEEIARITDYNLGTVKSRLARGRQQLREKLKGVI